MARHLPLKAAILDLVITPKVLEIIPVRDGRKEEGKKGGREVVKDEK
jgi:hypothetical protein